MICPKCGKEPYLTVALATDTYQARAMCVFCGIHTRIFKQPRIWRWPMDADDIESNEDNHALVQKQAYEAWERGEFVKVVEDVKLVRMSLTVAYDMIRRFLESEGKMTPGERVAAWLEIKRAVAKSGKITRMEVSDGA